MVGHRLDGVDGIGHVGLGTAVGGRDEQLEDAGGDEVAHEVGGQVTQLLDLG